MTYLVKIIEFSFQLRFKACKLLLYSYNYDVGLLTEDCHVHVDHLPVVYVLKHRDQHQRRTVLLGRFLDVNSLQNKFVVSK